MPTTLFKMSNMLASITFFLTIDHVHDSNRHLRNMELLFSVHCSCMEWHSKYKERNTGDEEFTALMRQDHSSKLTAAVKSWQCMQTDINHFLADPAHIHPALINSTFYSLRRKRG